MFNGRSTDVIHVADLSPANLCRLDGLEANRGRAPCGSLVLGSAGDDVTWTGRHAMAIYRSRMSATSASSAGSTSKRMYHSSTLAVYCIIGVFNKVITGRASSSSSAHTAAAAAAAASLVLQHIHALHVQQIVC